MFLCLFGLPVTFMPSPFLPGPVAGVVTKSSLRHGKLCALNALPLPLLFVDMMDNFSEDEVVEGQPEEC